MSSYKLTYFPIRGRAEVSRLMFAAAGVKYEDIRITKEQFEKLKASGILPFGQLPILEVDGKKVLSQSMTLLRFIARETGFCPSDNIEQAEAEMAVDGLGDMMAKVTKFFFEKDEQTKKILAQAFFEKELPASLVNFEKIVGSNASKHLAGSKMSYADIAFFANIDALYFDRKEDVPGVLNGYPLLKDVFIEVQSNAGIKTWLSNRPVTER